MMGNIKIKIAIAEDEPGCARQLQDNLMRFEQAHDISFEISVFEKGSELLEHYQGKWDLVFLDIDMPGMNGMETARDLRAMDQEIMIIFVTNLAQYAIQGYAVGAFDYILKPCEYYELDMKLQLAVRYLTGRVRKCIIIKQGGDVFKVPVSGIYYIEIDSHKLCYYTETGHFEVSSGLTLKKLEKDMEPYGFIKCNKSTLINIRHINSIEGDSIYIGTKEISVSRSHRKTVMEKLLENAKGRPFL